MEITVGNGYFEILKNYPTESKVIKKSDIQKIVSVQPLARLHRLFGGFSYLVLFIGENEIILPCFIVTQKNFFTHFGNYDNLAESFPYIPYIKPKNYVGINKIPELSLLDIADKPIKLSGLNFELLRLLFIGGLAFYTFTTYFFGQTWFLISLTATLIISLLLCLHKKVFIADKKLILRHFQSEFNYSFNEIESITEIKWSRFLSIGLSDPVIKMRFNTSNGVHKTIYFFPRKNGFKALKNKLQLK